MYAQKSCQFSYLRLKRNFTFSKESYVHKSVMDELRRIIEDSEVMAEDDALWPQPGIYQILLTVDVLR